MPPKKYYKKAASSLPNKCAQYLVIVESPSKCSKIEEYLGPMYQCIASRGHFRTIDGLSSIDVKHEYSITFTIEPGKQDVINNMRQTIGAYSPENIYLASDDDREGEAIAWHICDTFGLDLETTHRIVFHEITKPAIRDAIQNPRKINMNLVRAQFARQVLDMLVGFRISPVLWRHIFSNKKNALSAGRCQTPALRLVLDNETTRESEEESNVFYRVKGTFTSRNIEFVLNHEFEDAKETLRFLDASKTFSHILTVGNKTTESVKQSPKPFTTSRLLQASRWSPKQTMEMAQQLYQQGLITYMRTDAEVYSPVFLHSVKNFIMEQWKDPRYLGYLLENNIEGSEDNNPHEAIRCTNVNMTYITTENASVNALYRLIWQNTVESCMSASHSQMTKAEISSPEVIPGKTPKYCATIEVPTHFGWKVVSLKTNPVDVMTEASALLFYLKTANTNVPVVWSEIQTSAHMRDRVSHYTESSLIKKLEELGIGRPSTFATIVETLKDRGYVAKQDVQGKEVKCAEYLLESDGALKLISSKRVFGNETGKLVLQPLGRLAAEFLTKHFSNDSDPKAVFNYEYTSRMETLLDKISSGEEPEWNKVCKECSRDLRDLLKTLEGVEKKVFKLNNGYEFVFTSSGQTLRRKTADGEGWDYFSVRKDQMVDLGKLEKGEYVFNDLVEIPNEVLGEYLGETVLLKSGKYGLYVEHGENTVSLKTISIPARNIKLSDVIPLLPTIGNGGESLGESNNPNMMRPITKNMSVRKGKYGLYIYYKTDSMKQPKFFATKGFKQNVMNCDLGVLEAWIRETYL